MSVSKIIFRSKSIGVQSIKRDAAVHNTKVTVKTMASDKGALRFRSASNVYVITRNHMPFDTNVCQYI